MRARLILLILCFACLFGGCGEYAYPRIIEYGIDDYSDDNTSIIVSGAKTGMKGYEIVETETGIDVILHYDKEVK